MPPQVPGPGRGVDEPAAEQVIEATPGPALTPPRADAPSGPLLPLIIGSALFMQNLDSTAIANALPTMARSLHQEPLVLNLAITTYLLATAVFLPISGWVADRFGAKTVFQCAMVGFALSSLACGLSQTLWQIIAARALQGMAGALMAPVGRLVLLRSVPKSELVRAMSYLTMPALLGPVLGPPIGGFIVTFLSWRWIFYFNLPISLLGVLLTARFMPNLREVQVRRLDVAGFLLSGLALAGLVFGFENVGRSAAPAPVVVGLLAGGALCAGLYWAHFRRTAHAILDLSLLRIPTFRAATVGGFFYRLINGASPFLMALLLQLGFGLSAFQAGMLTFTSAAGALVMKVTAGPILRVLGFRRVLVGNAVLTAAIFAGYAAFTAHTPHWLVVVVLLTGGFFRSLQFTSLNALAYADVSHEAMSRASTFAGVAQQLAESLGVGAAALMIRLVVGVRHSGDLTAADISPAFVAIAALTLFSLFYLIPLDPAAGDEVSRRRR